MTEVHRASLYPVLPLRDIVVFPHMIVPLFVGREKSVRALEDVMKDDKQVLLVTQKNAAQDDPQPDDIYGVGTIGTVLQLLKLPDGTVKVLIEGGQRARIVNYAENPAFFQAYASGNQDTLSRFLAPGTSVTGLGNAVTFGSLTAVAVPVGGSARNVIATVVWNVPGQATSGGAAQQATAPAGLEMSYALTIVKRSGTWYISSIGPSLPAAGPA